MDIYVLHYLALKNNAVISAFLSYHIFKYPIKGAISGVEMFKVCINYILYILKNTFQDGLITYILNTA